MEGASLCERVARFSLGAFQAKRDAAHAPLSLRAPVIKESDWPGGEGMRGPGRQGEGGRKRDTRGI